MHEGDIPRRVFVGAVGAVLGASAAVAADEKPAKPPADRDPSKVLKLMAEGNKRFAGGKARVTRYKPADFLAAAEGQAPLATVVGCADSRVSPELLFDLGIGELFVIRVAGNVVAGGGPTLKGSIEYAVRELGVRLIMVLGHTGCGAVGSSRVDLQACKLEYSIVSPK